MSTNQNSARYESTPVATFEEWAEPVIAELMGLVDELRAEVASLRLQIGHLKRSAGRGLIHPSDLIEGWPS